jgi:hypothetical protein
MATKSSKAVEYALIIRSEEIADLKKIRGRNYHDAKRYFEETYIQWNGWARHRWPADIVKPGTQLLAFDSGSRKFVAILEISQGKSFVFKNGASFAHSVKRITGHSAAEVRRDPQYERVSARAAGNSCTGFAFCHRFVERIDVPFQGQFQRIGWQRDLGRLGIVPRSPSKDAKALPESASLTDLVKSWDSRDTTRLAQIEARIDQGDFRRRLLLNWKGCALTGVRTLAVLRASHIKPWRDCEPSERNDPANGILLTATFDALFDGGLISFTNQGVLLVSPALSPAERAKLGLAKGFPPVRFTKRHWKYLAHHRAHTFCED